MIWKKPKMSLDKMDPALLVWVAAILSAVFTTVVSGWAVYNYQRRQSQNSAATRQQTENAFNLMQQMASQTGDQKMLQEIIDARTKLLASDRPADDAAIKEILAQVPRLTEEYKKLETSKTNAAGQLLAEFRSNWEPLIQTVVSDFDRRVDDLTAADPRVRVTTKDTAFKVAGIGQDGGNGQLIRVAELNGVELRLYCSSAQVHPTHLSGGTVVITVRIPQRTENESNPLNISFSLKEATLGDRKWVAPMSAASTKEFADAALPGINKGIQDFLVLANSRK